MMSIRGADYPRIKHDHYPTPVEVTATLLKHFKFGRLVLDPACGKERRIVKMLRKHGYDADGDDLIFGKNFLQQDFNCDAHPYDIVTNPPFGDRRGALAVRFIERSLLITKPWRKKVAMLLPADFDSAKTRVHIFGEHPAFAAKLVLLDRIKWFDGKSGATNFSWYYWDWQKYSEEGNWRKHRLYPIIRYARIEA